jgi:hypothetical protein
MGRPRAAYHWNGYEIIEDKPTEENMYKEAVRPTKDKFDAIKIKALAHSLEERQLQDPIEFQHKLLANEQLPIGLRVAIAQNIAPYCHPRIGLVTMPRYVETPIHVPDFKTINEAEDFLLVLSRRVGSGELPIDATNEVTAIIRTWILSRRQGEELELKRLAASPSGDTTIRIKGGLPDLPGTSIIMPATEAMGKLGPDDTGQDETPVLAAEQDVAPESVPVEPVDPAE